MEEKILRAIENLQNQVNEKFSIIDSKLNNMETDVKYIKEQQQEQGQILKALEHAAQVNKAEHDNMQHDIAEIKGEIKTIREDLTTVEKVTIKNWNDITNLKAVK